MVSFTFWVLWMFIMKKMVGVKEEMFDETEKWEFENKLTFPLNLAGTLLPYDCNWVGGPCEGAVRAKSAAETWNTLGLELKKKLNIWYSWLHLSLLSPSLSVTFLSFQFTKLGFAVQLAVRKQMGTIPLIHLQHISYHNIYFIDSYIPHSQSMLMQGIWSIGKPQIMMSYQFPTRLNEFSITIGNNWSNYCKCIIATANITQMY